MASAFKPKVVAAARCYVEPTMGVDFGHCTAPRSVTCASVSAGDLRSFASINEAEAARDRALAILALRGRRGAVFGHELFGEAAWDLMLFLFVQYVDREDTKATDVACAAKVPSSVAQRYIALLIQQGHIVQDFSKSKAQFQYVKLSVNAYQEMLILLATGDG